MIIYLEIIIIYLKLIILPEMIITDLSKNPEISKKWNSRNNYLDQLSRNNYYLSKTDYFTQNDYYRSV